MSTVFYRWGAGRDESRVKFDGTHISVFDLKRQVMLDNNLGNGKDFDLVVAENGEELKDDDHQIARSSSLVVRRRPAIMKGRGTAQNYIIGTDAASALTGEHRIEAHARDAMKDRMNRGMGRGGGGGGFGSLTKRFDGKDDKEKPAQPAVQVSTGDAKEDAAIAQILQMQADTWEDMQEDMSTQPRFNTGGAGRGRPFKPPGGGPGGPQKFDQSSFMNTDKEPPVGYICYRCGQKGHWIQNCPKNSDPGASDGKRYVRVTGIPRSMLTTVEKPDGGEGSSQGAMLTADGGFVRAVPDARQWQKQAAVKTAKDDAQDNSTLDADLACALCKKALRDATRTPCCDTAYCEECIQTHLVEHDFECPHCESKITSLDKLNPDQDLRDRVQAYQDGQKKEGKTEGEGEGDGDAEVKKEGEEGGAEGAQKDEEGTATEDQSQLKLPDMNTMQERLQALLQTLRNPLVPPDMKGQLRQLIKMTHTNLMQMQMLAAQGIMFGAMGGMAGMNGMAGGMPNMMMMNPMAAMNGMGGMAGMPGMGMEQQMMPGNQHQGHQGHHGHGHGGHGHGHGGHGGHGHGGHGGHGGGRGGFRGGFRGRGFRGGMRGVRRQAEDQMGGPEKMQRVS